MEISKTSTRTFNDRTGYHRHEMVRLEDGRVATEVYPRHDGPDFLGYGRSITERPLTKAEWNKVGRGESIEIPTHFSTEIIK